MKVTYVDTDVLIAAARGNDKEANAAFTILNDPDRMFVRSIFLELELLPMPAYNRIKDEFDFYMDYFHSCARHVEGSTEMLRAALREAVENGLGGVDACHVVAAHEAGADELVTLEKKTKPYARTRRVPVLSIRVD